MDDKVFGELIFKRGWIKKEQMHFWNADREIKIRLSAYADDMPAAAQQTAYMHFKDNIKQICDESLIRIAMFCAKDPNSGLSSNLEKTVVDLEKHIVIDEVLFFKDGSYAIVCDPDWIDDNVAVLIENGKLVAGYGSDLLSCRI